MKPNLKAAATWLKWTKSQRRGALVVVAVLLLVGGSRWFWRWQLQHKSAAATYGIPKTVDNPHPDNTPRRVEINQGDSAAFEALPGIGPATARRIIRYRTKRGGFRSLADFKRVYGMDTLYPRIATYVYLDSSLLVIASPAVTGTPSQAGEVAAVVLPAAPENLNTVGEAALLATQLLPAPLARRLLHYRDARQGFNSWQDVARVYGITPAQLATLQQYYFLPANSPPTPQGGKAKLPLQALDINQATVQQLEALPAIGPVLAARIVAYRDALGFYASLGQLNKVYGLQDSVLLLISPYLMLPHDFSPYPHLDVNQLDEAALARHPLVGSRLARQLMAYRRQHGPYHSMQDVRKLYGVSAESLHALEPYLNFK